MKNPILFLAIIALIDLKAQSFAQPQDSTLIELNEVVISANTILGSKFQAKNRTGSAYYISPQELKKFNSTDINRVLRTVPGVNIYEEDGFGLRPNISLRGTSPERSSKITLMEDGVLIAPAPYSAPAAYYFPSVARMAAVEILKGSSQIQYGPFTTGGAINMLSTPIPEALKAEVIAGYGSFNSSRLQAIIGDSRQYFGYSVSYLNFDSDGFKQIDQENNTGFDKNDLVAKFRLNTDENQPTFQAFEVKFQYADEKSNETYLGLTATDFERTPFRRYEASQKDQMKNDHIQVMATHFLKLNTSFTLTTSGYFNGFSRNWYKLDYLILNDQKQGIANILNDPVGLATFYETLNGTGNSPDNALFVKANNREYASKGLQTKIDYRWGGNKALHEIEIGFRYHLDEEDRFQWVDGYGIVDGTMNLTNAGIPGTDANRISDAKALATYAAYKLKYNELTLTPGLRYENILLGRKDYGINDVIRSGQNLAVRENRVRVLMPGMGFNYNFDKLSLFGGLHKGFSPPSNQVGQKAEQSVNYELGSRFNRDGFSGEIVAFYNDYSNLLGSDLAATGGTGSLEQFNAGEVNVSGMEVLLNYDFLKQNTKFSLPLTVGYTFTDTEFLNSFGSEDELWGTVTVGDELPYISKHQFNIALALEHQKFEINLNGRYNGKFRTQAGSGPIPPEELVASNFIIDFSGKYRFSNNLSFTANIINVLDESYAVARVPAGLRPGHPFGIYAGIALNY
ncbi:MAG: TonB-dependent receptor [Flavobacteriaceae bacterium]